MHKIHPLPPRKINSPLINPIHHSHRLSFFLEMLRFHRSTIPFHPCRALSSSCPSTSSGRVLLANVAIYQIYAPLYKLLALFVLQDSDPVNTKTKLLHSRDPPFSKILKSGHQDDDREKTLECSSKKSIKSSFNYVPQYSHSDRNHLNAWSSHKT